MKKINWMLSGLLTLVMGMGAARGEEGDNFVTLCEDYCGFCAPFTGSHCEELLCNPDDPCSSLSEEYVRCQQEQLDCGVEGLDGPCSESLQHWSWCKTNHPTCGDGYETPSEQCDDGNTQDWDGCSSTCQSE